MLLFLCAVLGGDQSGLSNSVPAPQSNCILVFVLWPCCTLCYLASPTFRPNVSDTKWVRQTFPSSVAIQEELQRVRKANFLFSIFLLFLAVRSDLKVSWQLNLCAASKTNNSGTSKSKKNANETRVLSTVIESIYLPTQDHLSDQDHNYSLLTCPTPRNSEKSTEFPMVYRPAKL